MKPWFLSSGIHAAAVVALFSLAISEPARYSPARERRRILLTAVAPSPSPAPLMRTPHPPALPQPRSFRAPPAKVATLAAAADVPALLLDVPPTTTPLPAMQAASLLPPPPLKTDNLDTAVAAPAPARATGLQTAGFAAAIPPVLAESARPQPAAPVSAGFGDATLAAAAPSQRPLRAEPPREPTRPVEILSKPRPAYSGEARRLGLEGEVLLEVLFAASGSARVTRLLRGLGHGLDENAIAAATAIRYRPAERAGAPVDATATVHIVFQLAY